MSTERILVLVAVALPAFLLIGFALYDVIATKRLSVGRKVVWLVVIVATLLIGTLAYFLFRPLPDRRTSGHGGSARSAAFLELIEEREHGETDGDAYREAKRTLFARS